MSDLQKVCDFRDAAIADGWVAKKLTNEAIERWCELKKDGFTMQARARSERDCQISIWGPDGLQLLVPETYDMNIIRENLTTCNICEKRDVETTRYSFAGRCCHDCLPAMKRKYEFPGWYK